jgi:hypothetical protein
MKMFVLESGSGISEGFAPGHKIGFADPDLDLMAR